MIELIIVIAIVAVLAAVAFVAVDPAKRLHESRNAARLQTVNAIADALATDFVDNGTSLTTYVPDNTAYMVGNAGCTTPVGVVVCDNDADGVADVTLAAVAADVCLDLVGSGVLASLSVNPNMTLPDGNSGYYVQNDNGGLYVGSCTSEMEGAGGNTDAAPAIMTAR